MWIFIIMDIRKIIKEEVDDFEWARNVTTLSIGDVFYSKNTRPTPTDINTHSTFEIYDISPDGNWVRWSHHSFVFGKGAAIDVDKINRDTKSKGWDYYGYNAANSSPIDKVMGNIDVGHWLKLDVPGYLTEHPDEISKIMKLGTKKSVNESDDFGDFEWTKDAGIPDIHVGGKFKVPVGNVYTINKIDGTMVHWFGKDIRDGQLIISSDRVRDVQQRIDDGVWVVVD